MEKISRRDFLKVTLAAAGALQLSSSKIFAALSENNNAPIIWLQGCGCTGCSVSTLAVSNPAAIDDVLLSVVSMKFNNTIMTLAGEKAMAALNEAATMYADQFILVIEGGIPTGANGHYCIIGEDAGVPVTMHSALLKYGPMAKAIVAAGTCASFGGIPAAAPNVAAIRPVSQVLITKPVVNLPGCPVHPTTIISALVDIVTGTALTLDSYNRPIKYYSQSVHDYCDPPVCFLSQGCRGKSSMNVCSSLMWNNTLCTYAGNWCVGCAEPTFPTNPLNSGTGM